MYRSKQAPSMLLSPVDRRESKQRETDKDVGAQRGLFEVLRENSDDSFEDGRQANSASDTTELQSSSKERRSANDELHDIFTNVRESPSGPSLWDKLRDVDWKKWAPVGVSMLTAITLVVSRPSWILERLPYGYRTPLHMEERIVWKRVFFLSLGAGVLAGVGLYLWGVYNPSIL